MARDLYEVLGVAKTASPADIDKAYKRLAFEHHPDRNPGDAQAEAKFKEVQNAYDVLGDKAKRAQYDRYGSAGPHPGYGDFTGSAGGMDPEQLRQMLRRMGIDLGGGGFGGGFPGMDEFASPEDHEHEVAVPFETAAKGGPIDLNVNGRTISVKVPAGVRDGQMLRVKRVLQGGGNLLLRLRVEPHPYFERDGDDWTVEVPIALAEAVLGGKVEVPTVSGNRVEVTIPPGTSSGARLRLRGQGYGGSDLYLVVKVVVPKKIDATSRELIEAFAKANPQDPRRDVPWK